MKKLCFIILSLLLMLSSLGYCGETWIDGVTTDFLPNGTVPMTGAIETSHGSILANATASGVLTEGGTGGTYNENETANYESVANSILKSTTTGVTGVDHNYDFFVGARFGEGNRVLPAAGTDHRIRAYSDDTTQNSDYLELYHDQSSGIISTSSRFRMISTNDQIDYYSQAGKVTWGNWNSGTTLGDLVVLITDTNLIEMKITLRDLIGNQFIVTNYGSRDSDHDHDSQINPTCYLHSDTIPDIRNNEWGSEHHDKQNYIITSGAQIGAGTGVAQACTATNATNLFTDAGHILSNTDRIMIGGDAVPTGISTTTIYYVVGDTTDTFQVSLTSGGAAVTFSDDGTNVTWSYASENAIVLAPRGTAQIRAAGAGGLHIKECTTPSAIADWGAYYTKTDNKPYFQDGAGNEHEIATAGTFYGGMYLDANSNATVIETANISIMVRNCTTGDVNGFTFDAGSTGAITAYSDGTGKVNVASGTHGLVTGDEVSIRGTTNYNGVWTITRIDDDNFSIPDTWVNDNGASDWDEGSHLVAGTGSAGKYGLVFNLSCSEGGGAGSDIVGQIYVNSTVCTKCVAKRKFTTNDYGNLPGTAIITIADGDKVYFTLKSTGTNDITCQYGNLNIHRF